ncbi:hypothetical protein ACTXT7_000963 [Hymenolepis weldensis]
MPRNYPEQLEILLVGVILEILKENELHFRDGFHNRSLHYRLISCEYNLLHLLSNVPKIFK